MTNDINYLLCISAEQVHIMVFLCQPKQAIKAAVTLTVIGDPMTLVWYHFDDAKLFDS